MGLKLPEAYYVQLQQIYTEKKELFLKGLDAAGLTYTEPQGAYYVLVDISAFGAPNDTVFCQWLAKEVGVAAVPGSSFFKEEVNHLIRFHFAKKTETLEEAVKRLQTIREKVRGQNLW